jgi:hypothetical protein
LKFSIAETIAAIRMPKHAKPKPVTKPTTGRAASRARVEPKTHRHEHRRAAVDPGAHGDPQRLGGDELLHVDGRGEDRVVVRWNGA